MSIRSPPADPTPIDADVKAAMVKNRKMMPMQLGKMVRSEPVILRVKRVLRQ